MGPIVWYPDLLAGLATREFLHHLIYGVESAKVSPLEGGEGGRKGGGIFKNPCFGPGAPVACPSASVSVRFAR